ncbi:MAG: hypothetical protein Ta2E_02050 [Mycoplasmoidaceae bacterium]|nr:MAG: hypothetical protein Ta2E_02050 [Mycoplasmoidaceae bacterium]
MIQKFAERMDKSKEWMVEEVFEILDILVEEKCQKSNSLKMKIFVQNFEKWWGNHVERIAYDVETIFQVAYNVLLVESLRFNKRDNTRQKKKKLLQKENKDQLF